MSTGESPLAPLRGQHSHTVTLKHCRLKTVAQGAPVHKLCPAAILYVMGSQKLHEVHEASYRGRIPLERDVVELKEEVCLDWCGVQKVQDMNVPYLWAPDPGERAWPLTPVLVGTRMVLRTYFMRYWRFLQRSSPISHFLGMMPQE